MTCKNVQVRSEHLPEAEVMIEAHCGLEAPPAPGRHFTLMRARSVQQEIMRHDVDRSRLHIKVPHGSGDGQSTGV